ncbi:hypothetical protein K8O96_12015 [Clostridium sporogenes]|uniref:Uncharacterized protein n=1 Tax=Clostridium botulinum TaxID=1491 RepID=A0A6M0SZX3_CLOBO|nr:hypothetical protein [Clostridium sporogenes]NFA59481.1 hypothetical protein [Clostridium botulinum]NFI74665.1 hypothetical protein [Clostridium sporogenes]NFL71200.1 hypothetical protein [Clostridium sporogenes]NFM26121.1 hypothetical protein [Clostridium sporogenes]NFP62473.1 hypothetical protein [Clostridium sporogenes]
MDINNIKIIEELAKEMTREEFLDVFVGEATACPTYYGLCNFAVSDCDAPKTCRECYEQAIKDIKFKGENDMGNKIDYDREYNILEIMEFSEDREFINEGKYIVKLKDGFLKARYADDKSDSWTRCFITPEWLKAKFKLIKKDKEVTFEEAIQAYGKEIYCIWIDAADIKHKSEYRIYSNESILKDQNEDPIAPVEIFAGEWYIKED